MRLVFVHGINNEHNKCESIANDWWAALESGFAAAGLGLKSRPPITVGYYADLLAGTTKSAAVEMGSSSAQSTGLAVGLLQEFADEAGVSQGELEAAAAELGLPPEAVAQGVPHEGWVIAFAAALERVLPTKGKLVARLFLKQAVTYINDKALAALIDRKVWSKISTGDDPFIVVAHSLGTVVSYRVLAATDAAKRNVPLFLTLGSPLSVRMFKRILPARSAVPKPPIGRWFNARHKDDFVTLGRLISKKSIGYDGIEDCTEISGDDDDRHCIKQYLASPRVAAEIHRQL